MRLRLGIATAAAGLLVAAVPTVAFADADNTQEIPHPQAQAAIEAAGSDIGGEAIEYGDEGVVIPVSFEEISEEHQGHELEAAAKESTTDEVAPYQYYGNTYVPDYDGEVIATYAGDCYDGQVGWAGFDTVGYWYITYDHCEMTRLGATQANWDALIAHEWAHTRGWGHWEEPRAYNAAWNPQVF